jgi:hypothetical protein
MGLRESQILSRRFQVMMRREGLDGPDTFRIWRGRGSGCSVQHSQHGCVVECTRYLHGHAL